MRHRLAGGVRQLRELLPAEARYPAPAKVGQADILRRHAGAPRPEELSELSAVVHAPSMPIPTRVSI
jgi:hypothetical protein